jgi:hypothetical protein
MEGRKEKQERGRKKRDRKKMKKKCLTISKNIRYLKLIYVNS